MNRWYPYESHAEQWRKHRTNILIIVGVVLFDLGLVFLDLVNGQWLGALLIFLLALLSGWTALGMILNSGTWLKPWLPYSEKPEVKETLENLRALERAVQAHEETKRAEARRES